jgi:hypothetical protein
MAENTNPATPPAGEPGTPPAGNPPSDPPKGQEPKVFDEDYVKNLRDESAGYRKRAREAEGELQKLKDAQLSETERAKKEAADALAKAQRLESDLKAQSVRAEIAVLGSGLKIVDADAAYRLIDQAAIQFDDTGRPSNVKALLDQLVKDKPYLIEKAGVTTPPNNPGRQGTTLTKEMLSKMTAEQIAKLDQKEVDAALAA